MKTKNFFPENSEMTYKKKKKEIELTCFSFGKRVCGVGTYI